MFRRLVTTLGLMAVLVACTPAGIATPTLELPTPTHIPVDRPVPTATHITVDLPVPTGTPILVDITPSQLAALQALAKALNVPVEQIALVRTEAVDWPDGCLGVVLPGVICTQGIVPGFRVILAAGGRQYEYHTNQDGTSVISTQ